ncbi:hypothetical protein HDV00_011740 [Rhizophlyctis rosea]|nr:hypothetical protein HDV00_011740 [Rhizophlyctis rosea]
MHLEDSIAVNAKRMDARRRDMEKRRASQSSLDKPETDPQPHKVHPDETHELPEAPRDIIPLPSLQNGTSNHAIAPTSESAFNQRRRLLRPSLDLNFHNRFTSDKHLKSPPRRQRSSKSDKQPPVSGSVKPNRRNASLPPPVSSKEDGGTRRLSIGREEAFNGPVEANDPIPPPPPTPDLRPDPDVSANSSQKYFEEVSDVMDDVINDIQPALPPSGTGTGSARITCQCTTHVGHKILDERYACPAGDVAVAIFGEGGTETLEEIGTKAGIAESLEMTYEGWTVDDDGRWLSRCVGYDISFKAPLFGDMRTACFEVQHVLQQDADVLVVESTIDTPHLPYGTAFKTKLRYCITPAGSKGCRLRIHARVEYTKRLMMQESITKTALESLHYWVRDLDARLLDMAADACGLPRVWRTGANKNLMNNKGQQHHRGRALKRRESSYELFQREEDIIPAHTTEEKAWNLHEHMGPSQTMTPKTSAPATPVEKPTEMPKPQNPATTATYASPPTSPRATSPRPARKKPLGPRPLSPPGSPPASPPVPPPTKAFVSPPPLKLDQEEVRLNVQRKVPAPPLKEDSPPKSTKTSGANATQSTTSTDRSTPPTQPREAIPISSVTAVTTTLVYAKQTPARPAGAVIWTENGWAPAPSSSSKAVSTTTTTTTNAAPIARQGRVLRRSGGEIAKWVDGNYVVTRTAAPVTRISTDKSADPSSPTPTPTPTSPRLPPWHAARRRLDQHLALQRNDWALPGRYRAIEPSSSPTTPSSTTPSPTEEDDLVLDDIPPAFQLPSLMFNILLLLIHTLNINPITVIITAVTTTYHLTASILPSSLTSQPDTQPPIPHPPIPHPPPPDSTPSFFSTLTTSNLLHFFSLPPSSSTSSSGGAGGLQDSNGDTDTCGDIGMFWNGMSRAAVAWWVASKVAGSVVGSVGWIVVVAVGKVLAGRFGGKRVAGLLRGALGEAVEGG